MKAKVFLLYILCSLIFCQMLIGCMGNNTKQNTKSHSTTVTNNSILTTEKSEEQKTEEQFYAFVHELSIGNESSGTLVCYDFRNGNQALSFILTLISTNEARTAFGNKEEYDSEWLELKYTEDNVGGGFARLMLNFKKREDVSSYTVVFASGNK